MTLSGATWDLVPGTLVVLEGIDQAGKSTQLERLKGVIPDAHFTHQPSGGTVVGQVVYELTEQVAQMHPVSRQFLHLASHAEHYEREIIPALSTNGVVMDRCWWSTIAYGYFSGGLQYAFPSYQAFEDMVKVPAQGIEPAIVFLFMNAWRPDRNNTEGLISGYNMLADRFKCEKVPTDDEEATTEFIVRCLRERGLLRPV